MGLSEAHDPHGRTFTGQPVPNFQMLMISPRGNPELRTVYPPGGNSAPTADLARLRVVSAGMINPQADVSVLRTGIQSRRPTSSGRIPYLSAGP